MATVCSGRERGAWVGRSLVLPLVFLLAPAADVAAQQPPKDGSDKAAELKALLKERRETLDQAVKVLLAQYQTGGANFAAVLQAEQAACKAAVELEDTPEGRAVAQRKSAATAAALVSLTQALYESGRATQADVLRARAELLDVRIELLRTELRAKSRQ